MRELKFRAWDKLTGELINPEFNILGETTIFNMFEQYIAEIYETLPKRYDNTLAYLNDILIEQFTGLYDKNKTDIFEGDVLKNNIGGIAEVVFYNGCFTVEVDDEEFGIQHIPVSEQCLFIEVIGNIHENPELLNAKP